MAQFNRNESNEALHQKVKQKVRQSFPLEANGYTFDVDNITFHPPSDNRAAQSQHFREGSSMETGVRADVTVTNDKGKEVNKLDQVVLTNIPRVTERGSYILQGNEKVFSNQMTLHSGVYVNPPKTTSAGTFTEAEIRPDRGGPRFKFVLNSDKSTLKVKGLKLRGGGNSEVDAISLLKLIGFTDQDIKEAIGNEEEYESIKNNNRPQSARKVHEAIFKESFESADDTKERLRSLFNEQISFGEKSQKVAEQMTGAGAPNMNKDVIKSTISSLFQKRRDPKKGPNVDDIRFKEVHSSEDVIARGVQKGLNEWTKRLRQAANNNTVTKKGSIRPSQYVNKSVQATGNSNLSVQVDSNNPLDLHQKRRRITMMGDGGLTVKNSMLSNRNIQDTAFAKIDAVETSQSGAMGLVQHLARDARIEDNTIKSTFYPVSNGKVDTTDKVTDLDPMDEYDEYIAFHNPDILNKSGDQWTFTEDKVQVRHKGDFTEVDKNKVTLIDERPTSHMGSASSMVPFSGHNDGARMLMGSTMQQQSMALENPQAPIVQSISDDETGKTIEEELADDASQLLRSPYNGTVKKIEDDFIEIETNEGETQKIEKMNYFTTGKHGSYINHKPVVEEGDKVEEGQLLADGWQSQNGKMALGRNTKVAYMPFDGYNFEDGVVVSQSFADNMASEEVKTIEHEVEKTEGVHTGTPEVLSQLRRLKNVSNGVLQKLDSDGVIKKGEEISRGDMLVAAYKEKDKKDMSESGKRLQQLSGQNIFNTPEEQMADISKYVEGYQKGKVIDVEKTNDADSLKVTVRILAYKPMELGDKLAGRHGNKGTITKILPDAEMPQTEDGEATELLFSPLTVPSRKNLGQLLEINAGLAAEKKGMDEYKVKNFDSKSRQQVMKDLKDIGLPDGKQNLINPKTGKPYENKVTTGPMYIMKLDHQVEKKITQRNSMGKNVKVDDVTNMPKKVGGGVNGERHNPQSVGGMEFWSLTSGSAVDNIHEMTTLKSDGAGDKKYRKEIYNAIRDGERIPQPLTPTTVKNLGDKMTAAGLTMAPMKDGEEVTLDEQFNSLALRPMNKKDKDKLGWQEVQHAKTEQITDNREEPGGLYGSDIFGEDGDKWGKVTLAIPQPNPAFLQNNASSAKPYESMLRSKGFTQSKLQDIAENGKHVIMNPGDSNFDKYDIVDLSKKNTNEDIEELSDMIEMGEGGVEAYAGGDAIRKLLQETDLKTELEQANTRLKEAKNANQRSQAEQDYRIMSKALDNNMAPTDFLMDEVPVLPKKYRMPVRTKNTITTDDITNLYQRLIQKNEKGKKLIEENEKLDVRPEELGEDYGNFQKDLYESLQTVVGTKTHTDKRGNEYKGILETLSGKKGFLRDKMQSKRQDYSGRSVIVVDPELSLDEAGIPEDMAAEMFKPHIQGELSRKGYNPEEVNQMVGERTSEYRNALKKVAEDNPVILNRQPSLHRHSTQAFKPKIRWNKDGETNRTIGINPVVTTGYNADFDGDSSVNSVFSRVKEVDVTPQNGYNEKKKENESMPFSGEENIRYKYGLTNLKDFPRGELKEKTGNKEIYSVPEGVEVLTVWNNEEKWLPVESYSVHKDLKMLEVETNTSRTLQVSDDHSLVTVDEDLEYMRAPAEEGMTLPRIRKEISNGDFELMTQIELPKAEESFYQFKDHMELNTKSGYFFGAYIGDGWINKDRNAKNNKNAIYLADAEGDVIKRIQNVMNDLNTSDKDIHVSSVDAPHEFNGKESYCVKRTWYSSIFSELLRSEIGLGAANKKLPSFWAHSPSSFRWGILSGLIDTDGSVLDTGKQTHINITTTSHGLAYEVVGLAHTLNLTASVTITETPQGNPCYVVTFTQESIAMMKRSLWLASDYKAKRLSKFELTKTAKRNKYTPKLSDERLKELRKAIGSPRIKNKKGEQIVADEDVPAIKKRRSLYAILQRVGKQNTAIAKDTAHEIFEVVPELFEDGFWYKWKELVLDESVEWELITEIKPIPSITEAYDLTVPPNYTMVTESGIVIFDTMAVHVPITEAAKKEATEKLMPSKNLYNPTNNSLVASLKHEMQLGIYYMTRDKQPRGNTKTYKNSKELRKGYQKGDVQTYDRVMIQKTGKTATAGQHLFNLSLPRQHRDYEEHLNVDKKKMTKIINDIVDDQRYGQGEAARVINRLQEIGFESATMSGLSIGFSDFESVNENTNREDLLAKAEGEIDASQFIDKRDEFEQKKSNFVTEAVSGMIADTLDDDNPVKNIMNSGARGGPGQVASMGAFIGVGKDVENKPTRMVNTSFMEGLSPSQFWDLAYDSRKGIYDKSVETQKPGELTRSLWMKNKSVVITKKDCGTNEGVSLNVKKKGTDRHLKGRVLLKDVPLEDGGVVKANGKPITKQEYERIVNSAKDKENVMVRSPLKCKAGDGVCQRCYGAKAGSPSNDFVPVGDPIGSIAAQALGEPSQQAIMQTFHTGAGGSGVGDAFQRIQQIMSLPQDPAGATVLAKKSGTVTKITNDPIKGTIVSIDGKEHTVGDRPLDPDIVENAPVTQGQPLNVEVDEEDNPISFRNPHEVLELEGPEKARDYLMNSVNEAFEKGGIGDTDKRHLEVTVSNLVDRAEVKDPGTSGFVPGQTTTMREIEQFNQKTGKSKLEPLNYGNKHNIVGAKAGRDIKGKKSKRVIVKQGKEITEGDWDKLKDEGHNSVPVITKGITFNQKIQGVGSETKMPNDNWLDSAGYQNPRGAISQGAGLFAEDKLDNPLTQQMTGLRGNFGDAFQDFKNTVTNKFSDWF